MVERKLCGKCKEEKDASEFSKNNKKASGLQSYCKKCAHPHRAQWARDNTHKTRTYALKYTYGLTEESFQAYLTSQSGKCKICSKEFTDKLKPRVDHDHSCCGATKACEKCVRGLLCNRCNLFLGFYENFAFMDEVKKYLDLTEAP
jgi:hypothetical protein